MNKNIIKNSANYISMRNTERRKNNLSMQLDTTRSEVSLFIFPDATKHKKDTQKPNIKNELRQTLENRIQIEENSRRKFKKRQYNNNYYYDYNYNPFIDVRNHVKQFKKKLKNKHGSFVNIVNLVEQERKKKTQNERTFLQEIKNFQIMKQNYILRSNKMQQKSQVNIFNKKTTKKQYSPSNAKKNKSKNQFEKEEDLELNNLQIEQIAAFKEKNFFMDQKINIFHIVRNQISLINSNDYLKKRKFSMDSIVEKKYLIKLPIFRDLSQMGRNCVTQKYLQSKNISDYIYTEQETINIWHAQFADLLSVASNRISPDYLHHKLDDDPHLNHRFSDDNQSEEQVQTSITYKKKQINRSDNFSNINQEFQEVKDYLKSANIKAEEDNQRRMQQHSLKIMKEIKKQRNLTQMSINDEKLHLQLSDKTKQQIKKFIGLDKSEKTSDFSKLVSRRKSAVNKKSVIKLKALNNLLGQKNKLQQFQQKSSRSKSFKKMRRYSEI